MADDYSNELLKMVDFTVIPCDNYSNLRHTVIRECEVMNAAIYLRVSTTEQAKDGYGLDVQRAKCLAMAEVKGWPVVREFADEGISGTIDETGRPGLSAMLQAVCNGEIDGVIVMALDRLGRSARLVLDVVEHLVECDAEIVSCKESIDTSTPTGKFVLTVFAALAELERNNIVERTTDGRNARGKVDGERGGRVPMGYTRTDNGLELVESEAETVRLVFSLRGAGETLTAIADTLNERGIETRRGGNWHASSVRVVLRNEDKYTGGTRGESAETWPVILES